MKTELSLNERTLTLHRYPEQHYENLQAWDAGDEYLIRHVEAMTLSPGKHILILNDHFGALSCWFARDHQVTLMSDSYLSHQGVQQNLTRNGDHAISCLTTIADLPTDIDLVLFQLPKNNRHLIWQLSQLRTYLPKTCPVIAVNKAKDIHTSTLQLFEQYLGTTQTSLAWKKHRLVFASADAPLQSVSPELIWDAEIDHQSVRLVNLPNVFSGESLDLGARFFLCHIPEKPNCKHIIDLGCGNGVLSIKAGQRNPHAALTCIDESFMAVESARRNLNYHFGNRANMQCIANNCLDGLAPASADLILCNPPFHQQNTITDHIAWQMFCDAKHVLEKRGELLVIGNRHLGYDGKLTKIFGKSNVKTVAMNKKFVILQATKP
ncbi:methyltransferase [Vibrio spartinae]|uniref:Ribosomal RNA large subunit methyltransferase G n=1 Tax=Vibrio spartinae TaxID=1918945 RepID=A0A1N6M119_9VIBR|nr:methyltransferase [Vibrio spartinae]QMV15260.1 Ribosomal RNA large subunit methyltransferase G [Vibrio spartinae]SIO93129.1 Ribosomal RNA large subunit methyltransferase G [Vibrio spartinae]